MREPFAIRSMEEALMVDIPLRFSSVRNFPPRFGKVAVQMEFITPEQLKEALMIQVDDDLADRPHRNLGTILYDKGWINMGQLRAVIDRLMELLREEERAFKNEERTVEPPALLRS